jgi:hypothetical protein
MVKKYIEGETKEQRKARKAQEKSANVQESAEPPKILPQKSVEKAPLNEHKNYVVCLKFGTKYGPEYVNNLYNMVQRNLTLDHEFVCFTENADGLDENIRVEPLPEIAGIKGAVGWWWKPMFFNKRLPLKGTILYFDLDVIIFENIDKLFTHKPGEFLIIRDFNRFMIKNYQKFNSSVFRLDIGMHPHVWTDFIKNPQDPIRRYHGDQDWIRAKITKDFDFWPDEWIQSYKWEMRGKPQMKGTKGNRDFVHPGEPKILKETSVAVFHGDPNPHYCKDLWVRENWK